ncbi:MAG: EamA family transporter [Arenicellales bacterium]|nr:EamA family transporter [Arenicellales bacterium]
MASSISAPLLGVIAAVLFGISAVPAKRGLISLNAETGCLITMATTWVVCLLLGPLWMRTEDWFTAGFWIFVLAGLIHPYLSMYASLEALKRAGTTVASTLAATAPFFSTLGAVVLLGEDLTIVVALATVGIVAGVMVLTFDGPRMARVIRVALIFASIAAVIRGSTHVIGKWGLELMPNPFMATFVAFSVGLMCMTIFFRLRYGHLPRDLPTDGVKYFVYSGLCIAFAIISMYGALMLGRVVVISPIIASYPVFTLLSVWVVKAERISGQLVVGVLMVTAGVVIIALVGGAG